MTNMNNMYNNYSANNTTMANSSIGGSQPTIVTGSPIPVPTQQQQQQQHQQLPPPPPPPGANDSDGRWSLPPGWQLVHQPRDGRVYYWEVATGKTSWTHPSAPGVSVIAPPAPMGMSDRDRNGRNRDGLFGSFFPSNYRSSTQDDWEYDRRMQLMDTPANARRRPDSHQCCAIASLMFCLPLGILSLYHSRNVDRHWRQGRYGDSVNSSKQAYNFAWFGCALGGIILLFWWARRSDWEMPRWDFDFGDR